MEPDFLGKFPLPKIMSGCYVQYGPMISRPKGRRRLEKHGSQFSDIRDKPDILMIIFGVWYSDKHHSYDIFSLPFKINIHK